LYVAYVDDAGDIQTLNPAVADIQPIVAFGGIMVRQDKLTRLTREFLLLKRDHFGGRMTRGPHVLGDILVEVKGAELRTMVRGSHRKRRVALRYLDDLLSLIEGFDVRLVGRVWIKEVGVPLDGRRSTPSRSNGYARSSNASSRITTTKAQS
jgi:hypothetical protein